MDMGMLHGAGMAFTRVSLLRRSIALGTMRDAGLNRRAV